MHFQYLEVRPCIELRNGLTQFNDIASYRDEAEFEAAVQSCKDNHEKGFSFKTFWTLYGITEAVEATAIGDFTTKKAAHEVMNAIISPMAAARDLIQDGQDVERSDGAVSTGPERAADYLTDFINQCSNGERI